MSAKPQRAPRTPEAAAAVQSVLTRSIPVARLIAPADLEARLAALGVSVDRLIAAARIGRSTWADWRAGRTRPRPDRWAAAIAAFDTLVAEAAPAPADGEPEAPPAEPVALPKSSKPTGAPPHFVPVATAAPAGEPDPAAVDEIRRDIDSLIAGAVVAEADRVADLARRESAALTAVMDTDERCAARPGLRAESACRAAIRLNGRANRRLRSGARALAQRPATTPAALATKARAVLAIRNATDEDGWFAVLRDSVVRDAAQLGHASAETPAAAVAGAVPGVDPIPVLRQEWLARYGAYCSLESSTQRDEDAAYDLVVAVEKRALASRATTLAGAVVSIEWARAEFAHSLQEGILGEGLILALLDGALGVLRAGMANTSGPPAPAVGAAEAPIEAAAA